MNWTFKLLLNQGFTIILNDSHVEYRIVNTGVIMIMMLSINSNYSLSL